MKTSEGWALCLPKQMKEEGGKAPCTAPGRTEGPSQPTWRCVYAVLVRPLAEDDWPVGALFPAADCEDLTMCAFSNHILRAWRRQ